jgi:membrane protein involved in colicin uptake
MEIERMWKKKLENQKSKNYTKAMIAAVVIMVIIFAVLISFIG